MATTSRVRERDEPVGRRRKRRRKTMSRRGQRWWRLQFEHGGHFWRERERERETPRQGCSIEMDRAGFGSSSGKVRTGSVSSDKFPNCDWSVQVIH